MTSVLVADRHPLFREGLARAVRQRSALQLVGEVADGRTALDAIVRRRPDVAIVGADLHELDGAQVLNAVVRDGLATRVLLVAATVDAEQAYRAIAAGAAGVLSKQTDAAALCRAVQTAAAGDVALAPEAQTGLASAIRGRAAEGRPVINDREREILLLVAEGRSATEIAGSLHMSPSGAKTALLRIYERLGVGERAAAVAAAMRRGLIH